MDSRRLAIINTYLTIILIALSIVLIVLTIVLARDARRLDVLTHSLIGQASSPPEQSPTPTPATAPVLKSNTHTHSYADSEPDTITKPSTFASAPPTFTPPPIASL